MKKKKKKVFFGILGGILAVSLGFLGIRAILERTIETEREVEILESEATVANLEFIRVKILNKILLEFRFRALEERELEEEVLALEREVAAVSEKFRGLEGEGTDYELNKFFKVELEEMTAEIQEVKRVLGKEFANEGDRQLEFIETVAKYSEKERVGVLISRTAFSGERGDLGEMGIILVNGGKILVENGEEKVNLFLGGEEGVGLTTTDISEIEERGGGKVFSLEVKTGKMMEIGGKLEELTRKGRLTAYRVGFSGGERGKVKKTEISLRGKGTWDLEEELGERGITGLVGENLVENNIPETLMKILEEEF